MSIGTSSTPIFLWYSVDSFRLLSCFTDSSFTPGGGGRGGTAMYGLYGYVPL